MQSLDDPQRQNAEAAPLRSLETLADYDLKIGAYQPSASAYRRAIAGSEISCAGANGAHARLETPIGFAHLGIIIPAERCLHT
jgi:hypothetical protein